MKRLAIVEYYSGTSGKKGFYNSQEIGMANGLAEHGYECFIFYPDGTSTREDLEKVNEKVTVIHCPGKKMGVHGRFDWNLLKKYNVDFVQSNTDTQFFAPDCIAFCDKNNIPVYHYIGTIKSDSPNYIKRIIMNLLYRRSIPYLKSHQCFAKTGAVARELKMLGIDSEVVPVGLDIDYIPKIAENKVQAREKLGLPDLKKVILFVGRIDAYKQPLIFLDIVMTLDDNYYAVMIGSGKLNNELQRKIEKYALYSKVRWIKSVPNKDIHLYYKASDYFINLNDHEIFGMSILEAMYQGITVIAVKAPGPSTIIEHGKSGYLVKDIDEIKVLLNEGATCDAGTIQHRVLEDFCWKTIVKKMIQWIQINGG